MKQSAKLVPLLAALFAASLTAQEYNVSNTFTPADPELRVTRSNFGRTFQQLRGTNGRESSTT